MIDPLIMPCKICGKDAPLFAVADFGKTCLPTNTYILGVTGIPVYYRRCTDCGFVFTSMFDEWSIAEWSNKVYNEDYSLVDPEFLSERPGRTADWLVRTIGWASGDLEILDYGAGNGMTEQLLRRRGFRDITSFDPVFNPVAPDRKFDLITAFEVVEHSPDPVACFRQIASFMKPSSICVVQTTLTPVDLEAIRSQWWYMAPRNGHVSLYSPQALQFIARANGLVSFTDGGTTYMYKPGVLLEGPMQKLKVIESFIGWSDANSDYVVLADGNWHQPEQTVTGGPTFRWTASADDATMLLCKPAGFSGTFSVTLPGLIMMDGVAAFTVSPLPTEGLEVLDSGISGLTHRFVLRASGTRALHFSVRTSRVVAPADGIDDRRLGVAVMRPILGVA